MLQRGFAALDTNIPGVEVVISGAGDHMNRLDVEARHVKEICRSVMSGQLWNQPDRVYGHVQGPGVLRHVPQEHQTHREFSCISKSEVHGAQACFQEGTRAGLRRLLRMLHTFRM